MVRALLVIDVQNEYFVGGRLPLWQLEDTETRIVAAIGKARAAGDRIVLVQHVSTGSAGLFIDHTPGVAMWYSPPCSESPKTTMCRSSATFAPRPRKPFTVSH